MTAVMCCIYFYRPRLSTWNLAIASTWKRVYNVVEEELERWGWYREGLQGSASQPCPGLRPSWYTSSIGISHWFKKDLLENWGKGHFEYSQIREHFDVFINVHDINS